MEFVCRLDQPPALCNPLGLRLAQFEQLPYAFLIVMAFIYLFGSQINGLIRVVQTWVLGTVGV